MINLYDPMKATQMCLVSNVVILYKFKVLEFIKKKKHWHTMCDEPFIDIL
jgi:hypothetical protein